MRCIVWRDTGSIGYLKEMFSSKARVKCNNQTVVVNDNLLIGFKTRQERGTFLFSWHTPKNQRGENSKPTGSGWAWIQSGGLARNSPRSYTLTICWTVLANLSVDTLPMESTDTVLHLANSSLCFDPGSPARVGHAVMRRKYRTWTLFIHCINA